MNGWSIPVIVPSSNSKASVARWSIPVIIVDIVATWHLALVFRRSHEASKKKMTNCWHAPEVQHDAMANAGGHSESDPFQSHARRRQRRLDKLNRCDMHWPLVDCADVSPRWQETSATQDEAHKPPNKTTTSPKQPTAHPAQHTTTSDNIASNREYDIHL